MTNSGACQVRGEADHVTEPLLETSMEVKIFIDNRALHYILLITLSSRCAEPGQLMSIWIWPRIRPIEEAYL